MRRLLHIRRSLNQKGVSLTEYTLILTFVIFACIGTIVGFGVDMRCVYADVVGKAEGGFRTAMGSTGTSILDVDGDGDFDDADLAQLRANGCSI
jgi:Flp pilus assembly pilin Flp